MVSFYYEPNYSGSAIQAGNLSRYLQRRGVEPFIVSAMLESRLPLEEVHGVPVRRIPVARGGDLQIPSFWFGLAWFLWRRRRSYDIIHAHGTLQHGTASIMGRLLGKGSILKVAMHRSDIAFARQGRIWGRINRFYVRRFHRYIATSRQIFEEFQEEGMSAERIVRIPNGVDTEKFRPAADPEEKAALKARLGLPPVPVALFTGIVLARKNVDFVVRVFLRIRKQGIPGHLLIVGPGEGPGGELSGSYFDSLQTMIREAGLEADVTFTGRRPDVEDYVRASDLFLFAPRKEGMPNVLLEAMAGGLPCVVSRISGIEDVIEPGVNGYVLDIAQEDRFTQVAADLMQDGDLRARIGAKARKDIQKRYSLDVIADRYVELYRSLLDKRSRDLPR